MILDLIVLQINPEEHQMCDPKYMTIFVEGGLTYNPSKTRRDQKTTFRSNIRESSQKIQVYQLKFYADTQTHMYMYIYMG